MFSCQKSMMAKNKLSFRTIYV